MCCFFFFSQVLARGCHPVQQGGTSLLGGIPDRWVLDALRRASERQPDLTEQTAGAAASVLAGVRAFSWKMTRASSRAEVPCLSWCDFLIFFSSYTWCHLFVQFVSALRWGTSVVRNGNLQLKLCFRIRQTIDASWPSLWILLLSRVFSVSLPCSCIVAVILVWIFSAQLTHQYVYYWHSLLKTSFSDFSVILGISLLTTCSSFFLNSKALYFFFFSNNATIRSNRVKQLAFYIGCAWNPRICKRTVIVPGWYAKKKKRAPLYRGTETFIEQRILYKCRFSDRDSKNRIESEDPVTSVDLKKIHRIKTLLLNACARKYVTQKQPEVCQTRASD